MKVWKDFTSFSSINNHFSNPQILIGSTPKFIRQYNCSSGSIGRRCRQSSSAQRTDLCLLHCSGLSKQWVHATHSSYCRLRSQDNSRDMTFNVSSIKPRTSRAFVAESVVERAAAWGFRLNITLINLFLEIRTRSKKVCFPIKNLAPFWYKSGALLGLHPEDQTMHLDRSWTKSPWGTKPSRKCRYSGQGSQSEGFTSYRPEGSDLSWAGTKYFCWCLPSAGRKENLATKPYSSIMFKISCLGIPFWMKFAKTWSTRSILRMPLSSSSFQQSEYRGFWSKIQKKVICI